MRIWLAMACLWGTMAWSGVDSAMRLAIFQPDDWQAKAVLCLAVSVFASYLAIKDLRYYRAERGR